MEKRNRKTENRLAFSAAVIIIMTVCLIVTSFALYKLSVSSKDNRIRTAGNISVNLNDGLPIINDNDFLFEPGMTVIKEFFIENSGSTDVWYRLYFNNISGVIADEIDVEITRDDGTVLYSDKMDQLILDSSHTPLSTDDILLTSERRNLKMVLHFAENASSKGINTELCFDLVAEAVQVKNNPDRLF